ncbi:hypothetical protein ABZ471_45810 [Streptomyces sp. NPDC005728]
MLELVTAVAGAALVLDGQCRQGVTDRQGDRVARGVLLERGAAS